MTTRRTTLHALAAGALSVGAGPALAQDTQPITLLVGAASGMDFMARVIAQQMRDATGRTTIVLAKLGAGQRLALGEVRRAAPDGRTLVFATSSPFSLYPQIYNKLDYDPVADFTPICGVSSFDVAISTGPQTGATTLRQLVDWQRARKPGDAVFGSAPGNGSLSHFVGLSVGLATNVPLTHVAYKDSAVGLIDLASGRLPMMVTGTSPQVELHKAGRIRILAVSGETRCPLIPDVPTLKEAGVNTSASTSTALFGPPKLPPEIVRRVYDAITPMLSTPGVLEKLTSVGMTPWIANQQQISALLADERKRFEILVKASGYVREDE